MKTMHFIAAYVLMTLTLPVFSQNITVIDDAGTSITLAKSAKRIITLAPNLAELVYAAGAGDAMVAASRYSDYPEAVKKLPIMGDAFALNLEAISAAKPDVVFVWLSGTAQRQRDALKKLSIPVFESEIRDVQGIASTLVRMGTLAGTLPAAQIEASKVVKQWQDLGLKYQGASPVRLFYQVWDAPLMTFNGQHLISQAARACGGVQGFESLAALTPTVGREAVLAFNPQLIVTGGDSLQSLAAWRKLPQIAAVKTDQLKTVNAALLSRMGPRFVTSAAQMCETIDQTRRLLAQTAAFAPLSAPNPASESKPLPKDTK